MIQYNRPLTALQASVTSSPTLTPQMFSKGEMSISTVMQNGEPWFFAKEVCELLGIGNSRQAISRLYLQEKGVISNDTPGGVQDVSVISESGLFKLVMKSKKPEAEAFQHWVCSEVIPSIRKTGSYSIVPQPQPPQPPQQRFLPTTLPELPDWVSEQSAFIFRAAASNGLLLLTREMDSLIGANKGQFRFQDSGECVPPRPTAPNESQLEFHPPWMGFIAAWWHGFQDETGIAVTDKTIATSLIVLAQLAKFFDFPHGSKKSKFGNKTVMKRVLDSLAGGPAFKIDTGDGKMLRVRVDKAVVGNWKELYRLTRIWRKFGT